MDDETIEQYNKRVKRREREAKLKNKLNGKMIWNRKIKGTLVIKQPPKV